MLGRSRQAGDTIVEVLLAIMVVSVILSGAYVVTNKSMQGVRNSQEQTQASKIVENQLEQLRSVVTQTGIDPAVATGGFCLVGAVVKTSPSDCVFNQDNMPAASGETPAFSVRITGANDLYKISTKWDRLGGNVGEEIMHYRVYGN